MPFRIGDLSDMQLGTNADQPGKSLSAGTYLIHGHCFAVFVEIGASGKVFDINDLIIIWVIVSPGVVVFIVEHLELASVEFDAASWVSDCVVEVC